MHADIIQENNQSNTHKVIKQAVHAYKCTGVYMDLHQHTLLTSFVRWQMSRLISDSVSVLPQH